MYVLLLVNKGFDVYIITEILDFEEEYLWKDKVL